jgi:uncharacterized caspase-like protein
LTLYVLAIGISKYKDETLRLHYAAKDAKDFVAEARAQEGGLYKQVIIRSLTDEEATQVAILDGLDWITQSVNNTNDVAMVFLSGHGMTTPDQHYRFLPFDFNSADIKRTSILDYDLQQYLIGLGGKRIFFFDTCYSGNVLKGAKGSNLRPNVDKFANDLETASNGIIVFTSSTGDELSQETDKWENGVFTKAVVEGMKGLAARRGNRAVSVFDLGSYVSMRVKELTNSGQRPMTAIPTTVEDFWISAVEH